MREDSQATSSGGGGCSGVGGSVLAAGWVGDALAALGQPVNAVLAMVGGIAWLLADASGWLWASVLDRKVRFGWRAFYSQVVRLGVRSIRVVALVSTCIGVILSLQLAPPLADFGQTEQVATIIAVGVVRELGPLISAIVLTGFAGASIAAELGTMVVGEEIEAMEAHALNPVRFLVAPRVLACTVSLVVVCVFGELVSLTAGWCVGVVLLDIPSPVYINLTIEALDVADFLTGLSKAAVFGVLIGAIACYNGLTVTGGAAGVGRATTYTVVFCIECIIYTDLLFTAVFYRLGWT